MRHPVVLSVFNNKGGVGKTTLSFHLAFALSELGHRVLMVDLDPQCNLTIYAVDEEELHGIWQVEDPFIDDGYESTLTAKSNQELKQINESTRSIHYILKPVEEGGTADLADLPPPKKLTNSLSLIPGRLTLHTFEDRVAKRWNDAYGADALAIKTLSKIRNTCLRYAAKYGFDIVLVDTSPSLGVLNKVAISTVDGFIIPCMPDMFSLYGIRNIGRALEAWKKDFEILYSLIPDSKRSEFPRRLVSFLGFTIYNARKYSGVTPWDLALAHWNHAQKIPETIRSYIPEASRNYLTEALLSQPIGGTAVMHSHSTLPAMAQKYHCPIWKVPSSALNPEDKPTVSGNRRQYECTRDSYLSFACDVLRRVELLPD